MSEIKCIGILTSGGDAPGMNAAIRAVTRSAIFNGFSVKGIMRGYKGLVFNEIVEFKSQSVSNIIQLGGTILKTARCKEFTTPEGRKAAYDNMTAAGIDALVVIGGDGSLTGARLFAQEYNVPIVGLPGTIDNDLGGTDSTIGYDTALNTIMEAVDKLRDTASSHERLFFVEVMGHTAGYLALNSAIATGSEAAIIPEMETEVDQLAELINHGFRKSKNSAIVIVAETQDGRSHGSGRARQEGVPAIRCPGDDPGPHPARRIAHGRGPHPRLAHGRSGHRGHPRRTAQRDDRHRERQDRLRALRQGDPAQQGNRPQRTGTGEDSLDIKPAPNTHYNTHNRSE